MPLRLRTAHAAAWASVFTLLTTRADAAPTPPLPTEPELAAIVVEVTAAETAFAKTMADRRLDLFAGFVAEDAVFNGASMNIGRATVVDKWRAFFAKPQAPFSWAPDAVAVAADGRTAISTGPVRTPDGKLISRFTSIWRKDVDGHWRVIADQGVDACECPPAKK